MHLKEKICKYSVLGYRIDLYFHKHKLAIEADELGHADRNLSNEIERQKAREKELDCVFIRINSDENLCNIFKEIRYTGTLKNRLKNYSLMIFQKDC